MESNYVRRYRQLKGLSLTQLACQVGLAASTLSDIELNKRYLWPKARRAIAAALQVDESTLFSRENNLHELR